MTKIILDNLKKSYDNGQEAVKGVSFDVQDGEFLVLVGPSGCGKSTILRMIAGLEDISDGSLYFNENKVNDLSPKDRNIGMVFQNYALYPHLSVYNNLAFPLKISKVSKDEIEEKVKAIAEILNLTEYLNRKPKQLSGGQRQRVALGRAMIRKPDVFLFDEPLSNLDAKLRGSMRTEIIRIHREFRTTAIYVTHDQTEAMTMGDRIVVLKDGEIQQIGTPQEIYEFPQNIFVAGFVGAPPINLFYGRISLENGDFFVENNTANIFEIDLKSFVITPANGLNCTMALRPEALHLMQENNTKNQIRVKITNIEILGHESIIYFETSNSTKSMRLNGSILNEIGDTIQIKIDTNKAVFFDGLNGDRI